MIMVLMMKWDGGTRSPKKNGKKWEFFQGADDFDDYDD